jgi:hypothetical protein
VRARPAAGRRITSTEAQPRQGRAGVGRRAVAAVVSGRFPDLLDYKQMRAGPARTTVVRNHELLEAATVAIGIPPQMLGNPARLQLEVRSEVYFCASFLAQTKKERSATSGLTHKAAVQISLV